RRRDGVADDVALVVEVDRAVGRRALLAVHDHEVVVLAGRVVRAGEIVRARVPHEHALLQVRREAEAARALAGCAAALGLPLAGHELVGGPRAAGGARRRRGGGGEQEQGGAEQADARGHGGSSGGTGFARRGIIAPPLGAARAGAAGTGSARGL